jgi:hypothetical protein
MTLTKSILSQWKSNGCDSAHLSGAMFHGVQIRTWASPLHARRQFLVCLLPHSALDIQPISASLSRQPTSGATVQPCWVGRLCMAKGWKALALVHPGRTAAVPPLRLHCALLLGAEDIAAGSGCNIRGQGTSAPENGLQSVWSLQGSICFLKCIVPSGLIKSHGKDYLTLSVISFYCFNTLYQMDESNNEFSIIIRVSEIPAII